jgi:hypothetical protein
MIRSSLERKGNKFTPKIYLGLGSGSDPIKLFCKLDHYCNVIFPIALNGLAYKKSEQIYSKISSKDRLQGPVS